MVKIEQQHSGLSATQPQIMLPLAFMLVSVNSNYNFDLSWMDPACQRHLLLRRYIPPALANQLGWLHRALVDYVDRSREV